LVAEKKSGKDRNCGIPSFSFFVVCRKRRFVGLELASANEWASGGGRLEPGTGEENSRETRQKGHLSPKREKLAWTMRAPVIWAEKANNQQEVGDRRLRPVTTTTKWTLKD
jgi:hypothetical protein